ncbi:hypothetical protein TNCV_520761 [Trichonephila clavipes]|nr:hypothetical protein TNCV_520761 [Trichonephila clavipes]
MAAEHKNPTTALSTGVTANHPRLRDRYSGRCCQRRPPPRTNERETKVVPTESQQTAETKERLDPRSRLLTMR